MPKTSDFQTADHFDNLHSTIECQQPTADLYRFIGRIHFNQSDGAAHITCPLGPDNVVLRASSLKETPFIYGKCMNSTVD